MENKTTKLQKKTELQHMQQRWQPSDVIKFKNGSVREIQKQKQVFS